MGWVRRWGLPSILFIAFSSCATPTTAPPVGDSAAIDAERVRQREYVVERWVEQQSRLDAIASRIFIANADLCGEDVARGIGINVADADTYDDEFGDVMQQKYGLGAEPSVIYVTQGMPAEEAGLLPRDVIKAVNGEAVPTGRKALEHFAELMDGANQSSSVDLQVYRDGQTMNIRVPTVLRCAYDVEWSNGDTINAFADGNRIVIFEGMMRFTESDNELALVVAHELGHNAMDHIDAKRANATAGAIGGILLDVLAAAGGVNTGGAFTRAGTQAGGQSYSVEFEQEADYVALYYLERAGYAMTDEFAEFWRRMATVNPNRIDNGFSHPLTAERFVSIDRTVDEIASKKAVGQPLLPTMKNTDEE